MKTFKIGRQATRLATLALLAGLGFSSTAAFGADARSLVVDARGLDLESPEGVAALYSRLQSAAETVCGLADAHGYAERHRAMRCAEETLAAVVAEVGAGQLSAWHRAEIRTVRRSLAAAPVVASAATGQ